jgi:hypothetical protein
MAITDAMQIILHVMIVVVCSQFVLFSHDFREKCTRFLALRAELLANPRLATDKFCTSGDFSEQSEQMGMLALEWRQQGSFASPCRTPPAERRWPPRYYRIRLEFRLAIWKDQLDPIALEANYFR